MSSSIRSRLFQVASFGLYFYKMLYPKLSEVSRTLGRKEGKCICRFGLICFVCSQGTRLCKSSFFIFKLLFSLEAVQEGEIKQTSRQSCFSLPCDGAKLREDTVTEGAPCCRAGQARHVWWFHVLERWLVCACALHPSWCCTALDRMVGVLQCSPELLFELLEELNLCIWWKNLPVLLIPHAEVFLACQYSSIKYFQLSVLLTSIYSSGVKACVQHKWMSCLCSGCTAFTAGCREKT